jgi:RNA polymerase sigma-70 factor
MYFIERLTTTQLGELFGVEQSTAWRWLQNVRKAVYEATKQRLKERLHLTSGEFKSVVAAIRSQLDASISQILKE